MSILLACLALGVRAIIPVAADIMVGLASTCHRSVNVISNDTANLTHKLTQFRQNY